ncbi:hypothetical protein COK05_24435 [Bacillus cereus]|uniref:YopX protein domain-containing protein n=1 Tax=Bacillus cereus TaxID=1396 RepID=A0A2B2LKG4_BACCE|nr:YopX family protein [Bacillus cereus]PFQ42800.1 hypothetical protein COK05_24435 [Bacillus cereus]
MREIKFKAWDKADKEMYEVGYIDFPSKKIQLASIRDEICYKAFEVDMNEIEVLQYTGLKDKEGNGIYEGDVLKFSGNVVGLGIVKYNENFATFQACNGNSGWLFGNESGTSIEIIGNVYENLDLVGASK